MTDKIKEKLTELALSACESLELIFWGIEFQNIGKTNVIRIFIDKLDGISVNECARVSRRLNLVLDVEEIITHQYTLEVSSPGITRSFFTLNQLTNYINSKIQVKLKTPQQERTNFTGVLQKINIDDFELECDNEIFIISWNDVQKARLVEII